MGAYPPYKNYKNDDDYKTNPRNPDIRFQYPINFIEEPPEYISCDTDRGKCDNTLEKIPEYFSECDTMG
jgi:hypothetical protein